MAQAKPRLTYFTLRGRGEFLRLILTVAGELKSASWKTELRLNVFLFVGVEFEDVRYDFLTEWADVKPKLNLPYGQLPVYEDSEIGVLGQTAAIALYLGQK